MIQNKRLDKRLESGVALLAFLLTLALISVTLMGAVSWWSFERQRESEEELLFIGNQYRMAIERYYYATPGAVKVLPSTMEDLIQDDRFPAPVRHLRRLYPDPITGEPFELLRIGDQISGVASKSTKPAIKRSGFSPPYTAFEGLETYDQWKFLFSPPRRRNSSISLPSIPAKSTKARGTP
jgi:type II secretory pathway pseudopilin PulG